MASFIPIASDATLFGPRPFGTLESHLSKRTQKELGRLRAILRDTKKTLRDVSDSQLTSLWTDLLSDAVNLLRAMDRRERWPSGPGIFQTPVFGGPDLTRYFVQFQEFEQLLYGAGAHYRDHVIHVLRVWMLGARILICDNGKSGWKALRFSPPFVVSSLDGTKRSDREAVGSSRDVGSPFELFEDISMVEVLASWTIIALCHDLGYPLEKAREINGKVEEMLAQFGDLGFEGIRYRFQPHHQSLNENLLETLASKIVGREYEGGTDPAKRTTTLSNGRAPGLRFGTARQQKYYSKFAKSLQNYDHGIMGCVLLTKTLLYFIEADRDGGGRLSLEYEDARQLATRIEILRAIASHTCSDVYHVHLNSLAFLLIFCDEAQEWDRPTLSDMRAPVPKGQVKKVVIKKADISGSSFAFIVEFKEDQEDLAKYAKYKFRQFDKLLRCAVDGGERTGSFVVAFKCGGDEYKYDLSCTREEGRRIVATKPRGVRFDIWK